jgi:hypothetical protein
MRRLCLFLGALVCFAPATASAQAPVEGSLSVAPYIGAVLDTPDDWFVVGGEARFRMEGFNYDINPRFTYNPFEGGSAIQFDVNLLHDYTPAPDSRLRPYVGIGGAISRLAFEEFSDTSVGLNLVSGARLTMPNSRFEPFLNAQYTIIKGEGNPFTIVIGATFNVR